MKKSLLALLFIFFSAGIHASELKNAPVKTDFYRKESVALFVNHGGEVEEVVDGYLLVPEGNLYKSIKLTTFPHAGGPPIVESVFTANTDSDKELELIVLIRWEVNHSGIGTDGNYYAAYAFDNTVNTSSPPAFNRLSDIEKKIGEGLDGTREGKRVTFKYKNADAIRKLLQN